MIREASFFLFLYWCQACFSGVGVFLFCFFTMLGSQLLRSEATKGFFGMSQGAASRPPRGSAPGYSHLHINGKLQLSRHSFCFFVNCVYRLIIIEIYIYIYIFLREIVRVLYFFWYFQLYILSLLRKLCFLVTIECKSLDIKQWRWNTNTYVTVCYNKWKFFYFFISNLFRIILLQHVVIK